MSDGARTVAVFGVGRVGLPLALAFADCGYRVWGVDVNAPYVEGLKSGVFPFVEHGGPELLARHAGRAVEFTTDNGVAANADNLVLTLGTPVDEHMNPVFTQIEKVLNSLVPLLRPGHLLVLRSTVSPGTTEYIARFIESRTRLTIGRDLYLAFCPERIAEGKALSELKTTPQIVGADDPGSRSRARQLFEALGPPLLDADARSAELAKLFCNMYRYIQFALANEFMMIAHQWEREIYPLVRLVNEGYSRGGLALPGLAGGPCLYKDGFFLINKTPYCELISTAWKINETVPMYLVSQVKAVRPLHGAKVAILGIAFKRDIDDGRNALSYKLRKLLLAEGAEVRMHDPFLASSPLEEAVAAADVIFLAMNHSAFRELKPAWLADRAAPGALLSDVWNLTGKGVTLQRLDGTPITESNAPLPPEARAAGPAAAAPPSLRAPVAAPDLGIVIPVYNEAENIVPTLEALRQRVRVPHEIFVVHDMDEDTTVPVVRRLQAGWPGLRLLKNAYGRGALNAIKTGLLHCGKKYAAVVMADLSDDVGQINLMHCLMEDGADIVCGTRYSKGGSQTGGPFVKTLLSRCAGVSLHLLSGLPTSDVTNSFKLYRTDALRRFEIESDGGFEIGMELVVKGFLAGKRIAEVPTTWVDRSAGESRFQLGKWLPKYLRWYAHCLIGRWLGGLPKGAGAAGAAAPSGPGRS